MSGGTDCIEWNEAGIRLSGRNSGSTGDTLGSGFVLPVFSSVFFPDYFLTMHQPYFAGGHGFKLF
jgi:hypothetical protein